MHQKQNRLPNKNILFYVHILKSKNTGKPHFTWFPHHVIQKSSPLEPTLHLIYIMSSCSLSLYRYLYMYWNGCLKFLSLKIRTEWHRTKGNSIFCPKWIVPFFFPHFLLINMKLFVTCSRMRRKSGKKRKKRQRRKRWKPIL